MADTAAAALRAAATRIDRLDAEVLLADLLGIARLEMLMRRDEPIDAAAFEGLVARRAAGEPVAYITGRREFWSLDLRVTPDVLIPRPDSETLIEAAVAHFAGTAGPGSILDLGTGSGALLLAALSVWPAARGLGLDDSPEAIRVARENGRRLGLATGECFRLGGWPGDGGPHDLILCNPPYIAADADLPSEVRDWEPHGALFGGEDGLDNYRMIAPVLAPQLAPGGVACIEIGHDQAEPVSALFAAYGFEPLLRRDLAGLPRCLTITK